MEQKEYMYIQRKNNYVLNESIYKPGEIVVYVVVNGYPLVRWWNTTNKHDSFDSLTKYEVIKNFVHGSKNVYEVKSILNPHWAPGTLSGEVLRNETDYNKMIQDWENENLIRVLQAEYSK